MSDLLSHPAEQLLEYWNAKRGRRAMCAREDIDPMEIAGLLPNVVLVDVVDEGADFRFRLIGSEVRRHNPGDETDRLFSNLFPTRTNGEMWRDYLRVVIDQRPRICRTAYSGSDEEVTGVRQLLLPLSKDRVEVSTILVLVEFERREPPLSCGAISAAQAANLSAQVSASAA
jgi:hypothetical protein